MKNNKRIILDIKTDLHSQIKEFANKDDRKLQDAVRKLLAIGIKHVKTESVLQEVFKKQ